MRRVWATSWATALPATEPSTEDPMNFYRVSDQARGLAHFKVNPDQFLASVHPDMLKETHARLKAHNDALDLVGASGEFLSDWGRIPQAADHGQFAVYVDSLASALKFVQWFQVLDADMARHRVAMIASLDAGHPIAAQWRVIQARCYHPGQVEPWPEVNDLVEGGPAPDPVEPVGSLNDPGPVIVNPPTAVPVDDPAMGAMPVLDTPAQGD
ncbi:hypothetical protein UFOVP707_30 [uncultured Caudovirales phage]|uniref:Uncharacterized protein n=1 Tax=uncultured Caudovirales phage TaxID=2100421 RepID=A0A6J5NMC0_9CAUD|nr:hypothetical protein UFOVP707_30 [uncultured Caudovirales phage]